MWVCKHVWEGLHPGGIPGPVHASLSQAPRGRGPASCAALPVLAATVHASEFPLGHSLTGTWRFLPFHFSHSGGCTAVSHCGFNFPSPMTNEVSVISFFLHLSPFWRSFFVKCFFNALAHFTKLGLLTLLICLSSLYILDVRPVLDTPIYVCICTYMHTHTHLFNRSVPSAPMHNVTVTGAQQ